MSNNHDVATSDDCLQLLTEALPYVEADARYWDEGSLEGANRRRIAAATDLVDSIRRHIDRIRRHIDGLDAGVMSDQYMALRSAALAMLTAIDAADLGPISDEDMRKLEGPYADLRRLLNGGPHEPGLLDASP